nr:rod shape-determining protein MreC [bacterium]
MARIPSAFKPPRKKGQSAVRRMPKWLWVALAAVVVLVACALISPKNNPVSTVFSFVAQPVQRLVQSMKASLSTDSATKKREAELRIENQELKNKVAQLETELAAAAEARRDAEKTAALAEFALKYPTYEWQAARVTLRDPGGWFITFRIDKGEKDGICKNATVMTEQGLVGRVTEVGENYALVMAIIDGRSGVACVVERTRDQCVLSGQLFTGKEDNLCQLQYLPADADLLPGDRVLSSGLDGIYPKGFLLGVVSQIQPATEDSARKVLVKPAADFARLENVLVLMNTGTQEGQP